MSWKRLEDTLSDWLEDDYLERDIEYLEFFTWDDISEGDLIEKFSGDSDYRKDFSRFLMFLSQFAIQHQLPNLATLTIRILSLLYLVPSYIPTLGIEEAFWKLLTFCNKNEYFIYNQKNERLIIGRDEQLQLTLYLDKMPPDYEVKYRNEIATHFSKRLPPSKQVDSILPEMPSKAAESTFQLENEKQGMNFQNGFALVIGISDYLNINPLSDVVAKDAQDLATLLRHPGHCGYPANQVRLLLNTNATANRIRDELHWLANSCPENATVFIFFSGHGFHLDSETDSQSYLVPYDFDLQNLSKTAINSVELTLLLKSVPAERVVLVLDACHAGGIGEVKDISSSEIMLKAGVHDQIYTLLSQGKGRTIIASCRMGEKSAVLSGMQNSLFTFHLLAALRGEPERLHDGLVRILDVFNYVSLKVPEQASQHPILKAEVENNFPVALYFGGKGITNSTNERANQLEEMANLVDTRKLRLKMMQAFNLEELQILCVDVDNELRVITGSNEPFSLEIVGGEGLEGKITRLIGHFERRKHLQILIDVINRTRPGLYG